MRLRASVNFNVQSNVFCVKGHHESLPMKHGGNAANPVCSDNLAFVFAGHGLCTTRTTSDRRDELDRAFLAAELEDPFPANLLFDAELQSIFALLPAGVLLTCIVDAPCGDTVVRLPWFYDGKTGSFCGPPCARHSSLWQGDRHPRRERGAPNNSHFTIRGAPSSLAKAGTAKPKCVGPCDLFPGVAQTSERIFLTKSIQTIPTLLESHSQTGDNP
eukprot:symbB.v1.2.030870.t1/scaffold3523.1/size54856/2